MLSEKELDEMMAFLQTPMTDSNEEEIQAGIGSVLGKYATLMNDAIMPIRDPLVMFAAVAAEHLAKVYRSTLNELEHQVADDLLRGFSTTAVKIEKIEEPQE